MSPLRNTPTSSPRGRHTAALATVAAVIAGSTLAACSNSPVEPTATAASSTAAPTGPVHTGYTPGWGFGSGDNGSGVQTSSKTNVKIPVADSSKSTN